MDWKNKFICWRCKYCGYWQQKEIRYFRESISEKLEKTNLKCIRCNKSFTAKSKRYPVFNTKIIFYDEPKQCGAEVSKQNGISKE